MFAFVPLFKFRPFLENFISTRTATYPGNTMIKRMQSNGAGGKPKVYSGAIDCLRQILQKEGVGGATLFAPLEMLNEGDLFPGVTLENKNGPARLVSAAFPGFKRIHSPCEFFRQRALWWSDFLWHGNVVTKAISFPGSSFETQKTTLLAFGKSAQPLRIIHFGVAVA